MSSEPLPPIEPTPPLPDDLDPEVARWLEMGEARAFADIYRAAAERPGDPSGARVAEIGGAVAFGLGALDVGFFNRVVGLGVTRPATAGDVADAVAFYRDLGVTQSAIHVAPGSAPADLPAWLAAEGYRPGRRWVKCWRDLATVDAPSPAHRIERVDPTTVETYADVVIAGFGMPGAVRPTVVATVGRPGWMHYLGHDRGVPVAVAAVRIEDGVAWLGYGATLAAARGKGWQTAMFLRRLHDARTAGCRLAVTETGEETAEEPVNHSYRNMLRTGFRLAYPRRNWVRVA